jgi:NhaP-type Na+/H+ or K+/H+ antiporter
MLGTILTYTLVVLTIWMTSYSVFGQIALPGEEDISFTVAGGTVFALLALVVVAWVGGWAVQQLHLPPLLGMLVVGIVLKNVPYISVARGLDPAWSAALRSTALAVILLRAGLGLDPQALKQLSAMVFRLAFMPCLAETCVVAVTSHFLIGLPWIWGFMLGFVLAAVSPAVVVPCLLALQEKGWGVAKGIPTLVIAAASVDDVLAISAFTIILGITFNPSADLASVILQGPLEAVVGVVFGLVWGVLAVFLPPSPHPSTVLRLLVLVGGALLALFGSDVAGLPGSGALAVLVMAFVAGVGWRGQGWGDNNPVTQALATAWLVLQPLLFGLIGTEIQVTALDMGTVGWGVVVLCCGLAIRLIVSYGAVMMGDLNMKERVSVSLAWLPKATVQAAIGPLALDKAKQALASKFPGQDCNPVMVSSMHITEPLSGATLVRDMVNGTMVEGYSGDGGNMLANICDMVTYGDKVLTIAVLVILITAPIGAVAIMTGGPKLLEKEKKEEEEV